MGQMNFWIVTGAVMAPLILLASWIDYRQHRVPNWLNLTLAVTGLTAQATFFGWDGLIAGLLGLLVGLALLIVPWVMHLMGAGDVKLLAGIGAWLGPTLVFWSFAIGAAIGGVIGVVMILARRRVKSAMENLAALAVKCTDRQLAFSELGSVRHLGSRTQLLPYGVPLTIGALLVLVLKSGGWW